MIIYCDEIQDYFKLIQRFSHNISPATLQAGLTRTIAGVVFPNTIAIKNKAFFNIQFKECHFSAAIFEKCQFYDCEFTYCNLSKLQLSECVFENCVFNRSDFSETIFQKENYFKQSHFIICNLKQTYLGETYFSECFFDRSKISDNEFNVSKCINNRFAGILLNVIFRGKHKDDFLLADFSQLKFYGVFFRLCNLSKLIRSNDPAILYLENLPQRAVNALNVAKNIQDKELSNKLIKQLVFYSEMQEYLFDLNYLYKNEETPEFWQLFFNLLGVVTPLANNK